MAKHLFVCGPAHSGTTLMLAILDSHPAIAAVPKETGVFKSGTDDEVMDRIQGWPSRWSLDPNATYIVEKSPRHVLVLERIFRLFPEARVIIMERDGRDVAVSQAKRLETFRSSVNLWRNLTKAGLPFRSDPRVAVVRYETLIADTELTLRKVCTFLGILFDPAMLAHHSTRRLWWDTEIREADASLPLKDANHKRNRNWQINQPIFNGSGRWSKEMTPRQKRVFKEMAGDLLISLGYAETWTGETMGSSPMHVVQFWHEPVPPLEIRELVDRWRASGVPHRLFNDDTAELYIQAECGDDVLAAFRRCAFATMRSDIFRYCIMLKEGCIWADAATYPVGDIGRLFNGTQRALFSYRETGDGPTPSGPHRLHDLPQRRRPNHESGFGNRDRPCPVRATSGNMGPNGPWDCPEDTHRRSTSARYRAHAAAGAISLC